MCLILIDLIVGIVYSPMCHQSFGAKVRSLYFSEKISLSRIAYFFPVGLFPSKFAVLIILHSPFPKVEP